MRKRFLFPVVMLVVLLFGVSVHASLVDMNDGTIYDTDTQLSWLKDAGVGGRKNWVDAKAWAESLNVGGLTGWRLPTTPQPDASCSDHFEPGGGFPIQGSSFNCTSEMAHLYYAELGNAASGPLANTGPFTNLQEDGYYWSVTEYAPNPMYSWIFHFSFGFQNFGNNGDSAGNFYTWAVRSGARTVSGGGGGATPVGYNQQWLIITIVSLMAAGGLLLRRRSV